MFRRITLLLLTLSLVACYAASAQAQDPVKALKERLEREAHKRAVREAVQRVVNNELPITLDAKKIFPTVKRLPAAAKFDPKPLPLTVETLLQAVPPGDWTVPVIAFCTEHSVHLPGQGIAYTLGPLQGKCADASATLLWRGMFDEKADPHHLQGVTWAIQSGATYARLPKSYQGTIDRLIPDFKDDLNGNVVQSAEDTYQTAAQAFTGLPSLDDLLGKMGKPGELLLSAKRLQGILLREDTDDRLKEQNLFAAQNNEVFVPRKAAEGPWTEMIKGVAYMRFKVIQGNLGENVMELRVLPSQPQKEGLEPVSTHLVANEQKINVRIAFAPASLFSLFRVALPVPRPGRIPIPGIIPVGVGGVISYPDSAAQCLIIRLLLQKSLLKELCDALSQSTTEDNLNTLYHYTSEANAKAILASQTIIASPKFRNFRSGVFATHIKPTDNWTQEGLSRLFYGDNPNRDMSWYVRIDNSDMNFRWLGYEDRQWWAEWVRDAPEGFAVPVKILSIGPNPMPKN